MQYSVIYKVILAGTLLSSVAPASAQLADSCVVIVTTAGVIAPSPDNVSL